jgi:hypothetical protein
LNKKVLKRIPEFTGVLIFLSATLLARYFQIYIGSDSNWASLPRITDQIIHRAVSEKSIRYTIACHVD